MIIGVVVTAVGAMLTDRRTEVLGMSENTAWENDAVESKTPLSVTWKSARVSSCSCANLLTPVMSETARGSVKEKLVTSSLIV